jgi:PAS domain S-box-containing protein
MEQDTTEISYEQTVFDHAPIGLVLAEDRVIQTCNPFFASMFGYERQDLIGCNFSVLYPSHQEFVSTGQRVIDHPDIENYWDERIMSRKDGSLLWCHVRCRSFSPEDPLRRAVYSFEDLSETRPVQKLTPREREVVSLLVEGKTSKEIARHLSLSHRTVEVYRARLLKKYGASSTPVLLSALQTV